MERKPLKKTNKKIDEKFRKGKQVGVMFTTDEYDFITEQARKERMGRGQFIAQKIMRMYKFINQVEESK